MPPAPSHGPAAPVVRSQSFQVSNVQPLAVLPAVRVTPLPELAEHACFPSPHLIPPGLLVTRPFPTALTATRPLAAGGVGALKTNVAVTLWVVSTVSGVIWQVLPNTVSPVPEQLQLSKVQPLTVLVGASVIVVETVKPLEQAVLPFPQSIPAGRLVTVPLPTTLTVTVVVASERPPALPTPSASAISNNTGSRPLLKGLLLPSNARGAYALRPPFATSHGSSANQVSERRRPYPSVAISRSR